MEQKEIFDVIARFEKSSLSKLELSDAGFSIKMERERPVLQVAVQGEKENMQQPVTVSGSQKSEGAVSGYKAGKGKTGNEEMVLVKAPIVGVFYGAPSPEEDAFVQIGQKVSKGQTLCLVEAMKMMNELKSPVDGIIKRIQGINGQLVEFDQVLFEVEPC